MFKLLMRYATPATTWLFIISLVSGIALFFHVGQAYFRGMHEWLSMVLILPFILHIVRNWRPFVSYFKHLPMAIALVLAVAAGGVFAYEGMNGASGNPMVAILRALEKSTVTETAAIFDQTPEALKAALEAKGYKIASAETRLNDIATASGKTTMNIVQDLASLGK